MSSSTAATTTPHHATHTRIEHGVPVNPSQIEAVDAAATTTTTRSITQAELVSESFLPADSRRRQDGSDADTRTTIVTATTVPSSKQQISGGGAGGGGGRNDGKAAVDASLGASRLPQSGLRFCGYKWLLGAEDMLIPAACSIPSDLFVFVLSLVCIGLLPRHYDDMPDTCSHTDCRTTAPQLEESTDKLRLLSILGCQTASVHVDMMHLASHAGWACALLLPGPAAPRSFACPHRTLPLPPPPRRAVRVPR